MANLSKKWSKEISKSYVSLNEKELQVLKHWVENSIEDRLAKEAIKILSSSKEEAENMVASNAFIFTEMEKQAEEKGIQEGIKKVAEKMIRRGDSIEDIADITELTVEQVKKNQREHEANVTIWTNLVCQLINSFKLNMGIKKKVQKGEQTFFLYVAIFQFNAAIGTYTSSLEVSCDFLA